MLLNSNYIYCYKKVNKFLIYSKNSLILGTIFNYFIIILKKEKITINKKQFFCKLILYKWDILYNELLRIKTLKNIHKFLFINFFYFFFTLFVSGIGWRFFKKILKPNYKIYYLLIKLGHSFQIKFIIPKYFSFIRKGFYNIRLGFYNLKYLNSYLNILLKLKPTFKFKDIGLRLRKKKANIKKWNRNINKKK
jgi:hypothetical protein